MTAPLSSIRILDLSRILAGPWASQTLADLGAEVIKIEHPAGGDDTRSWGPPFVASSAKGERGDAAYFLSANRGKLSVCIDIATDEGQAVVHKLAGECDVVIENFKTGGLKKYGLDYDTLSALHPRLIYCSITGFGHTGPLSARAGYDFMIQGMGGIMSITGQPDGTPGAEPMKCGTAFADLFTGLYSVIAIQGALFAREQTGRGQHIDMALLDCQVGVLANQALNYLVSGVAPVRLGNAHPNIVPYQAFATLDGHIILAVGNDRQFIRFCTVAGLDALALEVRFATNAARVENRADLVPLIAETMARRTTAEWIETLEDVSVPCGPISTIDQVFATPQVVERGMQVEIDRDDGTRVPGVANPIRYSETPITYDRPPPLLGADTDDVLARIGGYSAHEIAELRNTGAVGTR